MDKLNWLDKLPDHLTAAEAAELLRCSRRTLARRIACGRIKALRPDRTGSSRVLIPKSELRRFLDSLAA